MNQLILSYCINGSCFEAGSHFVIYARHFAISADNFVRDHIETNPRNACLSRQSKKKRDKHFCPQKLIIHLNSQNSKISPTDRLQLH